MGLQCVYFRSVFGSTARTVPLSTYERPFHSPFQTIGLPSVQSVDISVPCMYCLTFWGLVSASHTSRLEAWMVTALIASNPLDMLVPIMGTRVAADRSRLVAALAAAATAL